MNTIGKEVICDRCHKRIFLRKVDSKELDGGYTTYDVYEEKPKEWKVGYSSKGVTRDLCPDCYNVYVKILKSFWAIEKGVKND